MSWAHCGMSRAWLCACVLALMAPGLAMAESRLSLNSADQRIHARVSSFLEMRERNLERQAWDASCGASALSTVLTHHFGDPYTEATIAVSILANTDPARVRERGGFSLLDLKRFAEAVGYTASGYGNLNLDDLADHDGPVIIPVRIRGLDHFVVFRGRAAGRVLIGDPAFGNLILSERRFAGYWTNGIGFFVESGDSPGAGSERRALGSETMQLTVPDLNYVYRLSGRYGPAPATRR